MVGAVKLPLKNIDDGEESALENLCFAADSPLSAENPPSTNKLGINFHPYLVAISQRNTPVGTPQGSI